MMSTLLVSCSQVTTKKDYDVYNIKLTQEIEGQVFLDSGDIYDIDEEKSVSISNSNEEVIQIGKQQAAAILVEVKTYQHGEKKNVYLSSDGNVRYSVSQSSESFFVTALNETELYAYPDDFLTEKKLLDHVRSYICQYVENGYLDSYVYGCYSSIVTSKENAAWKETKEGFCISDNVNEQVTGYRIKFNKYVGNMLTSDRIIVFCDEQGNIQNLYINKYPVDWTSAVVNEEKIDKSINSFLNRYVHPDYEVVRYTIKSQQLAYVHDEICLELSVSLSLKSNGDEFVVLCPFVLEIE